MAAACGDSKPSANSSASSASLAPLLPNSQTTTTFKPAFVGKGNLFFLSPSKNIGCALSETAARCDISDRSWTPPARPSTCDVDFGQGVQVVGTSPGMLTCAGDTVIVGEDVLQYGFLVTRGDFECRSEMAAMRCRNVKTGHGFSLSREKYTLN